MRKKSQDINRKTRLSGLRCFDAYEWSSVHGPSTMKFVSRLMSGANWGSSRCTLLWRTLDSELSSRRVLCLASSAPEDEEIETLLGTPRAQERPRTERYAKGMNRGTMLTTPCAADIGRRTQYQQGGTALSAQISMLPTPAPGTHDRGMTPHNGVVNSLLRGEKPQVQVLTVDVVMAEGLKQQGIESTRTMRGIKTGLKLQPEFVEWMMGFPQGWTELRGE